MFYSLHSARRCGRGLHAGFTLIELLVVVLIIGILAAIAIPQYQVATARAARVLPLLRSIVDAQQRYFMANAAYTADVNLLDVGMPYTSREEREEESWIYSGTPVGVLHVSQSAAAVFWSEDKAGFVIDFYGPNSICYPHTGSKTGEKVCASLGPKTSRISTEGTPVYALSF